MDLTPIANVTLPLLEAALTATIPLVIAWGTKKLGLEKERDLVNKITLAADAGAGLAYKFAVSHEGGLSNVQVHNAALQAGLEYVIGTVPGALKDMGLTPDHVGVMVEARLGKLLATDSSANVFPTPEAKPNV